MFLAYIAAVAAASLRHLHNHIRHVPTTFESCPAKTYLPFLALQHLNDDYSCRIGLHFSCITGFHNGSIE